MITLKGIQCHLHTATEIKSVSKTQMNINKLYTSAITMGLLLWKRFE